MTLEEKRKKRREYMRKYNTTEKGKEYNRTHVKRWREGKSSNKTRGSRQSRAAEYRELIVDFLLKRDGLICGICRESMEGSDFHIDHVIPIALTGPNTMENVRLTHPKCNMAAANAIRKQKHGY